MYKTLSEWIIADIYLKKLRLLVWFTAESWQNHVIMIYNKEMNSFKNILSIVSAFSIAN